MKVFARNVRVGDIVFHQNYPADVIEVTRSLGGGSVLIVWGHEDRDRCIVGSGDIVEVSRPKATA